MESPINGDGCMNWQKHFEKYMEVFTKDEQIQAVTGEIYYDIYNHQKLAHVSLKHKF